MLSQEASGTGLFLSLVHTCPYLELPRAGIHPSTPPIHPQSRCCAVWLSVNLIVIHRNSVLLLYHYYYCINIYRPQYYKYIVACRSWNQLESGPSLGAYPDVWLVLIHTCYVLLSTTSYNNILNTTTTYYLYFTEHRNYRFKHTSLCTSDDYCGPVAWYHLTTTSGLITPFPTSRSSALIQRDSSSTWNMLNISFSTK